MCDSAPTEESQSGPQIEQSQWQDVPSPVPAALKCPLCEDYLDQAVLAVCCGANFCHRYLASPASTPPLGDDFAEEMRDLRNFIEASFVKQSLHFEEIMESLRHESLRQAPQPKRQPTAVSTLARAGFRRLGCIRVPSGKSQAVARGSRPIDLDSTDRDEISRWRHFCLRVVSANAFTNCIMLLILVNLDLSLSATHGTSSAHLRIMRTMRLIRALRGIRVIRLLRYVSALRTLVFSIVSTTGSLMWTLVLLSLLFYSFGVILTQIVSDHCRFEAIRITEDDNALPNCKDIDELLHRYWNDVPDRAVSRAPPEAELLVVV
eukprot:g22946.t1